MTIQTQRYTVLVADAFQLASRPDALPPGLYRVESETGQMNGASFQARQWLFITIRPVDALGGTRPGEIYEMTRTELSQVLSRHASVLQPPNTTHAAMNRRAALRRRDALPRQEALPRTDALALERASNEGMAQTA